MVAVSILVSSIKLIDAGIFISLALLSLSFMLVSNLVMFYHCHIYFSKTKERSMHVTSPKKWWKFRDWFFWCAIHPKHRNICLVRYLLCQKICDMTRKGWTTYPQQYSNTLLSFHGKSCLCCALCNAGMYKKTFHLHVKKDALQQAMTNNLLLLIFYPF